MSIEHDNNSNSNSNHTRMENIRIMRSLMAEAGVDAMMVPTDDPHMSEYPSSDYKRREFISGFTGSAGTVVITQDKTLLFTDGRYHKQAENELDPTWTLMKVGMKDVPNPVEYLTKELSEGTVVGIDPLVHAATAYELIKKTLGERCISMKLLGHNPIDAIWGSNRPSKPSGLIREHPLRYAGKTVDEKLKEIRPLMQKEGCSSLVLSTLDDIAWLFNFRGSDVPCNPVSVCYAILTLDAAYLFIDEEKVPGPMVEVLARSGIQIRKYEDVLDSLQEQQKVEGKIWVDGNSANVAIYNSITSEKRLNKVLPTILMKACKNAAELEGMRACHVRDGAAVAEFLCTVEAFFDSREDSSSSKVISEYDIDLQVTGFRARDPLFVERSFPTIAGANDNGAIMHYRAELETCKMVTNNDLLLLDSGAQYIDGTTDVTRTFHTGTPTDYQREMFTRVLKGHIALDSQVFPTDTPGCLLDSFARQYLWSCGKNYLHGTGHGVGAALNVHEGPHRISSFLLGQGLKSTMIVSNEPGYYENGNFGIRIENLLEVVERPEFGTFGGNGFLGFRKLTMIPIQKKMLVLDLLTDDEVKWLNDYHQDISSKVRPLLTSEEAREWLDRSTSPIVRAH